MHHVWRRWGFSAFFQNVADGGVGDGVTQAGVHDALGKQAQGPAVVTLGGITARERGDLGTLEAIDDDGTARAWGVVETGEALGAITVAPGGDSVVVDIQGGGDSGERLAAVKFEQGGGAFKGTSRERAFGQQGFEAFAMLVGEGDMLFLHAWSLPEHPEECKKIYLTDY